MAFRTALLSPKKGKRIEQEGAEETENQSDQVFGTFRTWTKTPCFQEFKLRSTKDFRHAHLTERPKIRPNSQILAILLIFGETNAGVRRFIR
jgi:hypothetical protein